jgi:hypothetical protein
MPEQTYNHKPPLSWITNSEARTLGFHNYQIFDVLRGEGLNQDYHLAINSSNGGGGPFYDITLHYPLATSDGLTKIQIGDHLIVGDDIDDIRGGSKTWFRYDVVAILDTITASAGRFRVKYITDTGENGTIDPINLIYEYDSYSASDCRNIIGRQTNTDFLI